MTKVYFWIQIKKFRGTRDISQLECYPCKFHKGDEEEFMSTLRKRGAKYNRIVRSKDGATQMRHYEGDALSDQRNAIKSSDESTVTNPLSIKKTSDTDCAQRITNGSQDATRMTTVVAQRRTIHGIVFSYVLRHIFLYLECSPIDIRD